MQQPGKDLIFVMGLSLAVGALTLVFWIHYGRTPASAVPGKNNQAGPIDALTTMDGAVVRGRLVGEQHKYYVLQEGGTRKLFFKEEVARVARQPQYEKHSRYRVTLVNGRAFLCDIAEETEESLVVKVGTGLHRIPKSLVREIR